MASDLRPPGILTVNTGSSSIKLGAVAVDEATRLVIEQRLESGDVPSKHSLRAALAEFIDLRTAPRFVAVGHRVVFGGRDHLSPALITDRLLVDLRALAPVDPDHMPQALAGIEAAQELFPSLPQVACFDSGFHRTMSDAARVYALPARYREAGIERLGFHGLSCESVVARLRGALPPKKHRAIIAHLGSGASMTAVLKGKSVDTTMGFSPTGGLVMSRRSGDLDPGAMLAMLALGEGNAELVRRDLNYGSGLAALSGGCADMKELLTREAGDPAARRAIEVFCYSARKHLAGLTGILGGLDVLVFTGGIGSGSPAIRERICSPLEYLGIRLSRQANERNLIHGVISHERSAVTVLVMPADEESVIARHTWRLVRPKEAA